MGPSLTKAIAFARLPLLRPEQTTRQQNGIKESRNKLTRKQKEKKAQENATNREDETEE